MKFLILLISTLILFSSFAQANILKAKAKDYTCSELQDLVMDEGVVHIIGFGSLDVYAEESHACPADRIGDTVYESFMSYWSSSDKHFCFAGYACRSYTDSTL